MILSFFTGQQYLEIQTVEVASGLGGNREWTVRLVVDTGGFVESLFRAGVKLQFSSEQFPVCGKSDLAFHIIAIVAVIPY